MASIDRTRWGWKARYRAPDGSAHARTFTRKIDAEQFLTGVEHDKLTGRYVDPAAGRVTFEVLANRWRDAQVWRPATAAQVETNFRRHVLPRFGARPLVSIRPSEVQVWVRELTDILAPATVALVYRYFASVMRAAVTDRLIAASPCVGVKLPKVERARVVPLATAQVTALADAMPERYSALVVLGAGTGLRQGEAFGLTVDRVDFLRRTLTVDRQLVLLPGGPPRLAAPKTEASRRTVPLPQVVVDTLAAHLADHPAGTDGLVFSSDDGEPIRRTRFSELWRPAVKAVGLPAGTGFHALRHYYASLLIRHGESVKVVQARLGHASAAETLDTYSHLWPDSEDRTRDAVDLVLRPAPEQREDALR
jgi:integrase